MTHEQSQGRDLGTEVLSSLLLLTTPRAIDDTRLVDLGGVPQSVTIRGRDRTNPVLLVVHGGPGTPLLPTAWMWQRPVEEFFTVVHYDQRGAGRTFQHADPEVVRANMDVDQFAEDAVQLAEWLCGRLGVDRVAILGHSWGSVVATMAVSKRPDLFFTYVGVGQVVDFRAGEREGYAWVVEEGRRRQDERALRELVALAPYPGDDELNLHSVVVERGWVQRFGGFAAGRPGCDYFMDGLFTSPEYSEQDRASVLSGSQLHAEVLLPQLVGVDLTGVTDLAVPIVQLLGRHDHMTPTGPVLAWMDRLAAPSKTVAWFEDSAHMLMYEEPGRFLCALLDHVIPHASRVADL